MTSRGALPSRLVLTDPDPVTMWDSLRTQLRKAESPFERLIWVVFGEPPLAGLEATLGELEPQPSTIDLIQVGSESLKENHHPQFDFTGTDLHTTTVAPFSLHALLHEIGTVLEKWDADEPAACVLPLPTLLEEVGHTRTVHFLELLTSGLTEVGATPYYQLPRGADHERLTDLALIDEVIDATDKSLADHEEGLADRLPFTMEMASPGSQRSVTDTPIHTLQAWTPWLWITAIFTFGLGDIFTTVTALENEFAVEASPIAADIIAANGLGFIYIVKAVMFGLFFLLWAVSPEDIRVGVPLGLSLLGVGVLAWNLIILLLGFTA
jgi:hypothetical protein